MKKSVKKWIAIVLGFICSIVISYCIGTFQPNWLIKNDLQAKIQDQMVKEWQELGLKKPSIEYNNNIEFVLGVNKCIQWHNFSLEPDKRIPREIIIAMAVLETGWGQSRFAIEGNNLFGIRTWDPSTPQLKARVSSVRIEDVTSNEEEGRKEPSALPQKYKKEGRRVISSHQAQKDIRTFVTRESSPVIISDEEERRSKSSRKPQEWKEDGGPEVEE